MEGKIAFSKKSHVLQHSMFKCSLMKNIIHDLTFYFSDQCDSLRKLSDIVGAQSPGIIPGWTNNDLIGSSVWEKCGKDQAWHGYKGGSGVGSISTTFTAYGRGELSFAL